MLKCRHYAKPRTVRCHHKYTPSLAPSVPRAILPKSLTSTTMSERFLQQSNRPIILNKPDLFEQGDVTFARIRYGQD